MTFKKYIKENPIDYNITDIDLSNKSLSDIYGIEEYTDLISLNISSNYIKDLSPLKHLTKLENLWLNSNPITDISILNKLSNLKSLSLWNVHITDKSLDVLVELKNLEDIWLTGTKISSKYNIDLREVQWISHNRLKNLIKIIKIERRKRIIKLLN